MEELTFKQKIKFIDKTICGIKNNKISWICNAFDRLIQINYERPSYYMHILFPELYSSLKSIVYDNELYSHWGCGSWYENDRKFTQKNKCALWRGSSVYSILTEEDSILFNNAQNKRIEFLNNIKAMLINEHKLGNI